MADTEIPLVDLIKEVEEATAAYVDLSRKETEAMNQSTTALNRLNRAQAALDRRIEQVKNSAPRSSDWVISYKAKENLG